MSTTENLDSTLGKREQPLQETAIETGSEIKPETENQAGVEVQDKTQKKKKKSGRYIPDPEDEEDHMIEDDGI